jgi:hypothetical protein
LFVLLTLGSLCIFYVSLISSRINLSGFLKWLLLAELLSILSLNALLVTRSNDESPIIAFLLFLFFHVVVFWKHAGYFSLLRTKTNNQLRSEMIDHGIF